MSNFFLGQISVYGFNFATRGWAFCNGAILSIAQNSALFSLLGTNFGGNGVQTFGLPDYRGRTPMGMGGNTVLGEIAGTETVTILTSNMPIHTHSFGATNQAANIIGDGAHIFGQGMPGAPPSAKPTYLTPGAPNVVLNAGSVSPAGGSTPHNNIQPTLAVNFLIATTGIYPSRN
jgi:microcystin-dependent protein